MNALIDSILQSEDKETSPRIFKGKLPFPIEDIEALLLQQYRKAVARRGRKPDMQRVREHIHKVAKWLTDGDTKVGLLIAGTNGSGKSTMSEAIFSVLVKIKSAHTEYLQKNRWQMTEEQRRRYEQWISFPTPASYTATELAKSDDEKGKERYLFIDDLGTEPTVVNNYGTQTTPVVDILSYRYDRLLPTVITTNMTQEMISATYGKRIEGRLHEMCNLLGMDNVDYRHEDI